MSLSCVCHVTRHVMLYWVSQSLSCVCHVTHHVMLCWMRNESVMCVSYDVILFCASSWSESVS